MSDHDDLRRRTRERMEREGIPAGTDDPGLLALGAKPLEPTTCPDCGLRTRFWVEAAPGPSDWACVVCDLRAENDLLRESRARLAAPEPDLIACQDCGARQTHRVCEDCFHLRVVSDRIPDGEWDVHVWEPTHGNHLPGRVDVADRKRLLQVILAAAKGLPDHG